MDDHDLLVRIDERIGDISDTLDGHSPRIRRLEQFKSYCVGIGGVIAAIVGWIKFGGH